MDLPVTMGRPSVHRLPGNQGQFPVDGGLGGPLLLYAMRPALVDAAFFHLVKIFRRRFCQKGNIALLKKCFAGVEAIGKGGKLRILHSKWKSISGFKKKVPSYFGINPGKLIRVDGYLFSSNFPEVPKTPTVSKSIIVCFEGHSNARYSKGASVLSYVSDVLLKGVIIHFSALRETAQALKGTEGLLKEVLGPWFSRTGTRETICQIFR